MSDSGNNILRSANYLNKKLDTDPFWYDDYHILFMKDKLSQFFPTKDMTMVEKMNALMRMGIYLGVALYFVTYNYLYLFIPILIGVFTYYIYKNKKESFELYFNSIDNSITNRSNKKILDQVETISPTVNNPFMNINLITDDKTRPAATPTWNNDKLKDTVEDKFNYNLYRDVGDLYGKSNSQREYYTMPATTIPNEQTKFAKWLYSTDSTCKENTKFCTPQMDPVPYIDQTNPYQQNVTKY
jgi:hypothetical protein